MTSLYFVYDYSIKLITPILLLIQRILFTILLVNSYIKPEVFCATMGLLSLLISVILILRRRDFV